MRIAFPIAGRRGPRGDWTAARPGGADHSTLTLAHSLAETDVEPVIFVHGNGPTVDYVERLGLPVEVLDLEPVNKKLGLTDEMIAYVLGGADEARAAVARQRIDIVHTNDAALHRTWGLLKDSVGFRHVWHERGLFQHPDRIQPHLAAAEAVVTISRFVAARAPGPIIDRVQVVDNPVRVDKTYDRAAERAWLRTEFGLPEGSRVLTQVANGNARKRWPVFFEAASKAAKEAPDLRFLCLGYTIKRETNELMRQHFPGDLRERMVVANYRYDAHRIIAGTDVLVATAKDEPLGRTIIEAGLVGTPILAAASGGHDELLREIAPNCLVEKQTPQGFAEAFARLPDLISTYDTRLREPVREAFQNRFTPERHVDAIRAIYAEVLSGRTPFTRSPAVTPAARDSPTSILTTSEEPMTPKAAKRRRRDAVDEKIFGYYNTDMPTVAYCLSGLRRLSVDPEDKRARRMLLAHGPRFISRQQRFLYACASILPVDLFLDIGVNYGECLVALPLFSQTRVIGYEANPSLHSYIERTLSYNDDLRHVSLRNYAIGDVPDQTISFYVDASWTGKSSAVPQSGGSIHEINALTTTIDKQMEADDPTLLLVKLDIEGYEARAMRGAVKTNSRIANVIYMLEFDDAFLSRAGEDAAAFVEELGETFTLHALTSGGVTPIGSHDDIPVGDAKDGGRHTDLILTRFSDPALAEIFDTQIRAADPRALQSRLFAVG